MWVDAGSLREDWPNINKFGYRPLPEVPGIYLQLLVPLIEKQFFAFPDYHIAGSHIFFHKEYVKLFINSYDNMLRTYEKERIPLISDQNIMNSMLVSKVSFLHTILTHLQYNNKWFFFYSIF